MAQNPGGAGNRRPIIIVALGAALLGFVLVSIYLRGGDSGRSGSETSAPRPAAERSDAPASASQPAPTATQRPADAEAVTLMEQLFGEAGSSSSPQPEEEPGTAALKVTTRLLLAALLTAMLAYRPRRRSFAQKHNPFVGQTQILLSVVASALMMIVGDSAARAFGIFAAVSLVRFRTNIKDPKEITVLLVSLAIGLGTGVGRWELAIILSLFILVLLWLLEYRESEQVFRAMELTVKTRDVNVTNEALRELFRRHAFSYELRTLDRPDEKDPFGNIIYFVDLSPFLSTDKLSEEILVADAANVDSIEWSQQKTASYFYQ